jgi:hypothetical protein
MNVVASFPVARAAEVPVREPVNAPEHLKALDIGVQAEEEIPAKSVFLILIIVETCDQVVPGKVQNLKPH